MEEAIMMAVLVCTVIITVAIDVYKSELRRWGENE